MAAINNIGSQLGGNLSNAKKENVFTTSEFLRLGFCSPHNTSNINMSNNKRRFLSVTATYNDSARKMDTANRVNVNGIHVAEAPLQGCKLAKESATDEATVTSLRGRFVEGKYVFRQIFVIRSYEIGPDRTATMETLMNFLQVSFTISESTITEYIISYHIHNCIVCVHYIYHIIATN